MKRRKITGEEKHLRKIIDNYQNLEEDVIKQLIFEWGQGSTIGSNREVVWKDLFDRIVPKKFRVERGVFIIDSYGNLSREVDLAIYDEQYTPYIFQYGLLKFIPIEAVAAVIECKSSYPGDEKVGPWLDSIECLETSQDSIVRIAGRIAYGSNELGNIDTKLPLNTQTATKPIRILCYISGKNVPREEQENEKKRFDIVLEANHKNEELSIVYNSSYNNLLDWYLYLNHSEENKNKIEEFLKKEEEIDDGKPISGVKKLKESNLIDILRVTTPKKQEKTSLLSFIFQFNQLLMLINNPIFFPHKAYVKMFNDFLRLEKNEKIKKDKIVESNVCDDGSK